MTGEQDCINLLRLSFDRHEAYLDYTKTHAEMFAQIWLWHETLGDRAGPVSIAGVCDLCQCQTNFSAVPRETPDDDRFGHRVRWDSSKCGCNLMMIDRAVFRVFLDGGSEDDVIYHVGHYSEFRRWLSGRHKNLVSSQYREGDKSDLTEDGVRNEDITRLSFDDGAFDCVVCMEILEHVPDYRVALREMARVLKPGGRALLTFPWLGGQHYEHFTRAEMMPGGLIRHHHPPEYHGDPATAVGILSYRSFGWKILDELRECGFAKASVELVFGPLHGYMTLLHPVIVGVR